MRRLARDHWDALDAGRAGSDYANPLAGEIDALARPTGGLVPTALECFQTFVLRRFGSGKAAGREDAEPGRHRCTPIGLDLPAIGMLIKTGGGDARFELDVSPQVEPVSKVVQIAQNLGLRGVALGPLPFVL